MKLSRPFIFQMILIIAVTTSSMLGVDMILPSLPAIAKTLHASQSSVQETVPLFLAGLGLSLLINGPLSDFFGRKPFVVFGLLWSAIVSFLIPFAHHIDWFLILRFFQGIGAGAASGLCRVMIADRVQGRQLALMGSMNTLVITVSLMWAPALGGYLESHYGWQFGFIVLGSIQMLVLLFFTLFAHESNQHKKLVSALRSEFFASYKQFFQAEQSQQFFLYCVISGLLFSLSMILATLSPYIFIEKYHLSPINYGWVMFCIGFASMTGRFIAPAVLRFLSLDQLISIGIGALVVTTLCLLDVVIAVPTALYGLIAIVMLTRVCSPLIGPSVMAKALSSFESQRGMAGSFYGLFSNC